MVDWLNTLARIMSEEKSVSRYTRTSGYTILETYLTNI